MLLFVVAHTIYSFFISFVQTPSCVVCGACVSSKALCNYCSEKIHPLVPRELALTQRAMVTVYVVGAYEETLKALILKKNNGIKAVAYSALLGEMVSQLPVLKEVSFDCIIPIPLHWTRRLWRRFNQAEEIARVISKAYSKPIVTVLKRSRKTKFQSECTKEERLVNISQALYFLGDKSLVEGKIVLLVDDLVTTGATIKEAARLLYKFGAKKVIACAAARTK